MSIKKQFVKSKPVCKVTFTLPASEATTASVIGDFNGWDPNEGMFNKLKNGSFKTMLELDAAANYEFRYIVDGEFINEPEADSFKWNEFANAENSVLEL